MPKITNEELIAIPGSSYQFSAVKPADLEATEYTLVSIVLDISGSVDTYANDLLKMVQEIVQACQKNPRSENLMLQLITFNTQVKEAHGFKLLSTIGVTDYKGFNCGGSTALYDGTNFAILSLTTYAEELMKNDFNVNGAIYIVTDGEDNQSVTTRKMIRDALEAAKKEETIESLITVLIGVNTQSCQASLEKYVKESGLNQFVEVGAATPNSLAKLAGFISKSISSQSQALGTGGPSQQLTF